MRKHARKRANNNTLADRDSASVVQQHTLMDSGPVTNRQVVAVGKIDTVINLHTRAHVVKDVAPQHAAKADSQPQIESNRRSIKHLPEPEKRLSNCESFCL